MNQSEPLISKKKRFSVFDRFAGFHDDGEMDEETCANVEFVVVMIFLWFDFGLTLVLFLVCFCVVATVVVSDFVLLMFLFLSPAWAWFCFFVFFNCFCFIFWSVFVLFLPLKKTIFCQTFDCF